MLKVAWMEYNNSPVSSCLKGYERVGKKFFLNLHLALLWYNTFQVVKFCKLQSTARTEIGIIVIHSIVIYRGYLEVAFFSQYHFLIKVE